MKRTKLLLAVLLCAQLAFPALKGYGQQADNPNPTQRDIQKDSDSPLYRVTVNVVERTTPAINYRHQSGSTTVDFKGTELMPAARGEAKIESKQGYTEVEVEFDDLEPATRFGPEFLTYVMWAVTPQGRASNLGEVLLNGDKSKLNVTTEQPTFALIVTAEPYFVVSQPSDLVVMENVVRGDTKGKIELVDAKYELLKRGQYTVNVLPANLKPLQTDKDTPLELLEARNAVRIAEWAGSATYARDTFRKAQMMLTQAEDHTKRKDNKKAIVMAARDAVQLSEDARLISIKKQDDDRLAAERQAADRRQAEARQQTAIANQQAAAANQREAAALTQAAQERERAEREARLRAQAAVEEANARNQAERAKLEAAVADERARAAKAQADSEVDKARQAALEAERDRARIQAQSEAEKAALRSELMAQLSRIIETRDSARGLIVNMSDVLFDTGKYTLRPEAREKLAKVSGILLSHPGLAVEVEGHTDDVGTDDYNQRLSEQRADSVSRYLSGQGLRSIAARGYGESRPLVPNDSSASRQRNRRVELIVSGELIGTTTTVTLAPAR